MEKIKQLAQDHIPSKQFDLGLYDPKVSSLAVM